MNTGKHNPDFQLDYQKKDFDYESYAIEIDKKDFFSILHNYQPTDRYDEEKTEELIISDKPDKPDKLGNYVYILFKPTFNVSYSENYVTGVPTYDKEETHISIIEVIYTKGYSDKIILNNSSFTDEELSKIEDELRILCK
jgi:hypothetical protein